MKLNWNFPGGWGCKTTNLSWGEYGYFLELHNFEKRCSAHAVESRTILTDSAGHEV